MEVRISSNARAESKNSGFFCSKCHINSTKYLEYINLGIMKNNENLDCILEFKVPDKEAFIIL